MQRIGEYLCKERDTQAFAHLLTVMVVLISEIVNDVRLSKLCVSLPNTSVRHY